MVIRFSLKHLFAIVTIVAIASAFVGWVGISAALYILVIVLLLLICFFPIGTSSLYWWLALAGAFFSFVLYESTIPPEMDIRIDWVLLLFVSTAVILVLLVRTVTHYAKMGSVTLQKRRLNNKDHLTKDEHTRSSQQVRENECVTEQQPSNLLKRIGKVTALCGAIALSLLTFPNAILWMIGAWLACFTWIRKTSRLAWFPLAACVVILFVKGPYWSPGLIAIALAMIAVAAQNAWLRRSPGATNDLWGRVGVVALWLVWLGANWEAAQISHAAHPRKFDSSRPVVCLGDSLTTGLSDAEAYPKYLQGLITSPVINLGRAGITAREALKQLPDVLDTNPQVVIIELGGHDFLRDYGRDLTRESLVQIIEACKNAGADVVLF